MASISSPGIGSGIDVNSLVTQLVAAEAAPVARSLDRREAELQAELSAYGSLRGALTSFRSTVGFLSNQSAFTNINTSSSDEDVVTATASDDVADGNYRVKVDNLAESHSLVTKGFDDANTIIGEGSITFKFGTGVYTSGTDSYAFTPDADKAAQTISIDANSTLQDISEAVNKADIGVTAGVVFDGSQYRLTFTTDETGADNAIEVTVVDDTDSDNLNDAGLSQLAFNTSVTNLEETIAAEDANFSINGLNVTSSSNTVTDAIEGVTLNLVSDSTKTIDISISRNTSVISNQINNFVDSYNELIGTINDLSGYDADTDTAGILLGDGVIRSLTTQLRNTINNAARDLTGTYNSLASVGITTERDGTLVIDSGDLNDAIQNDPDAVAALFTEAGRSADNDQVTFVSSKTTSREGSFAVNISQAARQGSYTSVDFGYDSGTPITVDGSNDAVSFRIDGLNTGTIELTHGNYTGAQLAVELQTRINGIDELRDQNVSVKVIFDDSDSGNEHFVITSDRYGDASKVEVVSVEGGAFGLSGGSAVDGLNVEGTIGGFSATGSGRTLTSIDGIKVELQDDLTGDHGTVTFTRGIASRLNSLVNEILHPDAGIASAIEGFETSIEGIDSERERLTDRLISLEDRLRAQFSALDLLVSQLNTTSNFLNQQLSSLPPLDLISRNNR